MNSLIISAVGADRHGIVSELTGIITNHGGNIEESRMARMGSDFTIIMLVKIDPKWEESLLVALQVVLLPHKVFDQVPPAPNRKKYLRLIHHLGFEQFYYRNVLHIKRLQLSQQQHLDSRSPEGSFPDEKNSAYYCLQLLDCWQHC